MPYDVLISGAGPAGLCLASALSGRGLSIALVEQQPLPALAEPAFDGREIALTQASAATLQRLACGIASAPQSRTRWRRCATRRC